QRAKDLQALRKREIEERATVALEDVERDEARRHPRPELVGDVLSPEPRLEIREGHGPAFGERQDLAVDHVAARDGKERLDELRIAVRDPIEGAGIELH